MKVKYLKALLFSAEIYIYLTFNEIWQMLILYVIRKEFYSLSCLLVRYLVIAISCASFSINIKKRVFLSEFLQFDIRKIDFA